MHGGTHKTDKDIFRKEKRYKMRLTADLIQNSLSYINPLTERELDLRGAYSLKGADTTLF